MHVVAREEEGTEHLARLNLGDMARGALHVLEHAELGDEGFVFLRVITDSQAMTGDDLTGVGFVNAGQNLQQSRFTRTVEPENDDPRAAVDRKIGTREDLERTVGLGQSGRLNWRLPDGCRCRKAQLRDAILLPHLFE